MSPMESGFDIVHQMSGSNGEFRQSDFGRLGGYDDVYDGDRRGEHKAGGRIGVGFDFNRRYCYATRDREWTYGESRIGCYVVSLYNGYINGCQFMEPKLPNFLVIGAMKAGTTTLYRDLYSHPSVFFPEDKEPADLSTDQVLTHEGRQRYERLFSAASPGQVRGDASTQYSRLPNLPGVAERAKSLIGPDLKIIYLVREPVARIVSHHRHLHGLGQVSADINRVVREDPSLIDFSKYAMQLETWIEAYGLESINVIRFETYVTARAEAIAELCRFLGVDDPHGADVDEDQVFNASEGKPTPNRFWRVTAENPLYRRIIKPLIPWQARARARQLLFSEVETAGLEPLSLDTVEYIRRSTAEDLERLRQILGLPEPLWTTDPELIGAAGGEQSTA